jgi:hypothetical protein
MPLSLADLGDDTIRPDREKEKIEEPKLTRPI